MTLKLVLSCSLTKSCPTLCDPMDCSTPAFPVLHYLWEFAQTHVHWVGDAIQPSRPLLHPSPPAFNLSQHQGLFQCVGSYHQMAKVLQLQHQSFQWIFRVDFLSVLVQSLSHVWLLVTPWTADWLVCSPCCLKDSQSLFQLHTSKASILQCSAFFMVQHSHLYMTTGKTIALTRWTFLVKWCLCFSIHCLGLS